MRSIPPQMVFALGDEEDFQGLLTSALQQGQRRRGRGSRKQIQRKERERKREREQREREEMAPRETETYSAFRKYSHSLTFSCVTV